MNTPRLGFACQYRHAERELSLKALKALEGDYNPRTTTLRWMDSVTLQAAQDKLLDIVEHNLAAQIRLLGYVAQLPEGLRMLRLSSDLLPFYSHPKVAAFYQSPAVMTRLGGLFAAIGEAARQADIRLSFHPGQFCVLGSDRPEVVENSLAEFEYHADMIRMMGYGQRFQDFKCNVHIAGRLGAEGVRSVWPRLSEVARRCITFENDEKTYGVDDCLLLADLAPVVLDIHHCWIHEGRYIDPQDPRVDRIVDSWRGVRPVMHYSQPPETLQALGFTAEQKLEMDALLNVVNKRDLYLHSDRMWNDWTNRYALQFVERFDIMFEAKDKNLAVEDFYHRYRSAPG
ncbi:MULTISPECIES: UV DNA damage repair endonuclease UvsE [unclassified Pseudomonas]|uniref:UV DNA damage repair endonuclease UvsE n=1 Tax=unclassified Pseudomonas TaxID=196821 RepID=UPI000D3411DC|nr:MULTISPECIES: UV DNA damage repair endonuclease UvsE [unclassified Pseudomonas]RAU39479.1 UV DNA damage repair endonuclease UvsE [Pseudomonas sp. RIT 409]RAU56330.1 UV DNA damage repair endonuclease UvsE [Pseudomonas sp. RIT 412]